MTPTMAAAFLALAFSFLCLYLSYISCGFRFPFLYLCSLVVLKFRSLQILLSRLFRFAFF